MAKIITLSSQVSQGFVGNSAISFALQRLGHEVCPLPSVLLSNHPAHDHYGGIRLKPSMLRPIIESLDMNGYLEDVDAIITGYLPTEELVHFAIEAVTLVKAANPDALYLCDPVLGDDDKITGDGQLYIDKIAARTLQYELLPFADILTPNKFELSWLADLPVGNKEQAREAMDKLSPKHVLATSIPEGNGYIANMLKTPKGLYQTSCKHQDKKVYGSGDLLAAFYLAEYCDSKDGKQALAQSSAYIDVLVSHVHGAGDIDPISSQQLWSQAKPVRVSTEKQKTSS